MKKIQLYLYISAIVLAASAWGQTNRTGYFRIISSSASEIAALDASAGTISCLNAIAGATNQIQRTYDLPGGLWKDYVQLSSNSTSVSDQILDLSSPPGMTLIPGGIFQMGDTFSEGSTNELPVHSVYISPFYMSNQEVTKAQWDDVYNWADNNGYFFDSAGAGKAANHPVHTVSWYDAVKWCNARSEKEGKIPCYTIGGQPYRYGQSVPVVNWSANGYRLPTEAEWEKAARGGLNEKRFGNSDAISHSIANYFSNSSYDYDLGPTTGYNPAFASGAFPYTNPAGVLPPNAYGIHDMEGNLFELCWDRWNPGYYAASPKANPRGPASGTNRTYRGGNWGILAEFCRLSYRFGIDPTYADDNFGFRVCRSSK